MVRRTVPPKPAPGADRKRTQRTTAAALHSQRETDQALADAAEDPATAALLRDPDPQEDGGDGDDDDDDSGEVIDLEDADDEPAPPDLEPPKRPATLPMPPPPPQTPAYRSRGKTYERDSTRPLHVCGFVCTTNWVGHVEGQRVSVKFGAPLSTIPKNVRAAMAQSRIRFAVAMPPERRGTVVVDEPAGPPRARRRRNNPERSEDTAQVRSRFRPIAHLPSANE